MSNLVGHTTLFGSMWTFFLTSLEAAARLER
jgi:hypothetical protein